MPIPRIDEIRTISAHASYHGWPSIARRRNGEWLVVASAGRISHVCPFGQIHLLRSEDEGATWTREIVANTPLDDRDCGVLETKNETLLVNWFTSIAWKCSNRIAGGGIASMSLPDDLSDSLFRKIETLLDEETITRELSPWIIRSEDGGRTWSEKINPLVGAPHGPTELEDGRIVYVGNPRHPERNPNGSPYAPGLSVSSSEDDGRTWTLISKIPVRDGDREDKYHEPHVVQAADGRLVVHIRNHNEQDIHRILQCESEDGGRSWSTPHSLGVYGFPAHLLKLNDGRLLSTYGYRHTPYGNRAILSEDNSETWSEPMTLTAEEQQRDIGYPATAELPDGSLRTVWYEYMHHLERAVIRMARWSITA